MQNGNCSSSLFDNKSLISEVSVLLDIIESELKALSLWSLQAPSKQQLASTQPFCLDTLRFEQWLQFVFISKFRILVEQGQALPKNFSILPMAKEAFQKLPRPHHLNLLNAIRKLDRLLTD